MTPDNLSKIDLKLLVTFNALMEERSVTRAADRLDSSQPAVSRHLSQLRKLFGDELFTRQSHGLLPSSRAEKIHHQLKPILDDILRLVSPTELEPRKIQRTFSISMIDPISQGFSSALFDYLEKHAPGIRLKIQNLETYSMDSLIAGHLDFIINFGDEAPANIHSRIVAHEKPVCMLSRYHPLAANEQITREQYHQQKHVDYIVPGFDLEELPQWLLTDREVYLETNNMVTALKSICQSQMIMIGGEILGSRSPMVNEIVRIPFASDDEISTVPIRIMWHSRHHEDAEHRWMRSAICKIF